MIKHMRTKIISMLLAVICLSSISMALTLPQREHPFLLADEDIIERANWRSVNYIWAYKAKNAVKASADNALRYLTIPDEPGVDNHKSFWLNLRNLGLGYVLTGYEIYAEGARDILMQYADVYPQWGYAVNGILDTCRVGIYAVWGYDLIYNSPCLSEADKQHIETNFFYEIVDWVMTDVRENNHQTFHNALIAGVGFTLEDADLVEFALEGERGLHWQLNNFVLTDGWWSEKSPGYHMFTLEPLQYTVQAAYLAGFDYTTSKAYKGMFDAPIATMLPDKTLPSHSDTTSDYQLAARGALYEHAYEIFRDPQYLRVLQLGDLSKRENYSALFFGADSLPAVPTEPLKSNIFEGENLAVLRQGSGSSETYICMDYGPHGMWHGHRDKLSLIVYSLGQVLSPDPSLPSLGASVFDTPEWKYFYRQTFAHNTVCVDQKKQKAQAGRLRFFYADDDLSVVQAECCQSVYSDVLLRRTIALTDRYFIDIFQVSSENEYSYDWVYRNYGTISSDLELTARSKPIGYSGGFEYFSDIKESQTNGSFDVSFTNPSANLRIKMLDEEDTRVFLGKCDVLNLSLPTMVVRRNTDKTAFISVIEPYANQPKVDQVRRIPVSGAGGAYAIEIICSDGVRDVFFLADKEGLTRSFDGAITDAKACYIRTESCEITKEIHINE